MSGVQLIEVPEGEAGARLDKWFRRRFPHIPHSRLQKLLRTGQIRVDGSRAKADTRLTEGQEVRVPPLPDAEEARGKAEVHPADADFIRSLIIYQDDQLIALNKPSGLAVQGGTKTTRHVDGMLPALAKNGEAPRLAHRLDRDTSGILVLGRTPAATAALAKAFQSHAAQKTYWAVTVGVPSPRAGLIKGFLRKAASAGKGADREVMVAAHHGEPGAVHARTRFSVMATAGKRAAWVALQPETGRTHQLRIHMTMAGVHIAGDGKYHTDREPLDDLEARLHLHARALTLPHPKTGKPLALEADLPSHMQASFETLGFRLDDVPDDPFADIP